MVRACRSAHHTPRSGGKRAGTDDRRKALVLNGVTVGRIALAAEIAEFSAKHSSRDDLAYAYWVLLQATGRLEFWPRAFRIQFEEIQRDFFHYGLPPQTVRLMSEDEADRAAERILALAGEVQSLELDEQAPFAPAEEVGAVVMGGAARATTSR